MGVRLVKYPIESASNFTTDHNLLENRNVADQHPISAITDLEETLEKINKDIAELPNQFNDTETIHFEHDLENRTLASNVKVSEFIDVVGEDEEHQIQRPNSLIIKEDGLYAPEYSQDLQILDETIKNLPTNFIDSRTIDFEVNHTNVTGEVKIINSTENALEIRRNGLFVDKYFDLDIEDTNTVHFYFEGRAETLEEMFNNGKVFSHRSDSWENIQNATEANAWYFDSDLDSFVQPINTDTFTGFVSTIKYRTYIHRVTCRSTDADNDANGLVIAYTKDEQGKPHTLSVLVNRNAENHVGVWTYALVYDMALPDQQVLFTRGNTGMGDATLPAIGSGWSGDNFITVEAEKQGTIVSCAVSNWNSTTINLATTISIDLTEYSWGYLFVGKVQYGYCNKSQAYSYFTDIYFKGKGALKAEVKLANDEENRIEKRIDGLFCTGGSGGSGASSILEIEQPNHQLKVGDPVYCDTDGLYKLSFAEDSIRVETIGIVTNVVSENKFIITLSGQFATDIFDDYNIGSILYLSDTKVGMLTDEPLLVHKPIAIKIQGGIIINIQRASYYGNATEEQIDVPPVESVEIVYYTHQDMVDIVEEIWSDEDEN